MPIESGHMPPFDGIRQNLRKRRSKTMINLFELVKNLVDAYIYYSANDLLGIFTIYVNAILAGCFYLIKLTKELIIESMPLVKMMVARVLNYIGKKLIDISFNI